MKNLATLVLALPLFATTLAAQSAPSTADPVVMSAGTITIRQSEFEHAITTLPADYQEYVRGEGKRKFAEDYLRMRLLADAGSKAGLATNADVIMQVEMMKNNIIANAHLKAIENNIAVTEAQLRQRYATRKSQSELITAKHILIAFKGSPAAQQGKPELTEEQAKAKAEALHAQILAGASFEEVAKKESDDVASGQNGGDLGEFGRGQMVEEFDKAAFEAPVGKLAPVTRTQFGYHLIFVVSRGGPPFEQVRDDLLKEERTARVGREVARMMTNAKPTYSEGYFGAKKP